MVKRNIFLFLLFLVFIVNIVSADLIFQDNFNRGSESHLNGSGDWYYHAYSPGVANDKWDLNSNTAYAGDSANNQDYAHVINNTRRFYPNDELVFDFSLDSDESGNNMNVRFLITNATGEAVNGAFQCLMYATDFIACYNDSTAKQIIPWGSFVADHSYRFNITIVSEDKYNVNIDHVDYGDFGTQINNQWDHFTMGYKTSAGVTFGARVDNLTIQNSTTAGAPPPPGDPPSLVLSTDLVANSNYSVSPLYFNISAVFTNVTDDNFNCSLYTNNTQRYYISNISINDSYTMNLTYGFETWGYDINVTCMKMEQGVLAISSIVRENVFIDAIIPSAVEDLFTNNSLFYYNYSYSPEFRTKVTDYNLFATNASFIHPNGTILWNQENISLTGTEFNITASFDLNNISKYHEGLYQWDVWAWDSHTSNKINPSIYEFYYNEDGDMLINDELLIYGDDIKESFAFFAEDRYKFKLTFHEDSLNHEFYIYNDDNFMFMPDSPYKGHFVWFGKYKRWIDFMSDNIKSVNVEQLSNSSYKLTVYHHTITDEVEMDSIGDLNEMHKTWNLYLFEPSIISAFDYELYEANVTSQLQRFTVTVYEDDGSVNFSDSVTDYYSYMPLVNVTKNISVASTGYTTQYQNVNLTLNSSYAFYLNSSLTTYITFYDSSGNPNVMNGIVKDNDAVWNFSSFKLGVSSLDVAQGDVAVLFNFNGASNWTQYYEWENDGNIGDNIDIYTIDDANMYAYYRILDTTGSPIEDAEVQAWFQYPGSDSDNKNNYTLMGQRLSDSDGYAFFWFDSNSQVKILVEKEGYGNVSRLYTIADEVATSKDDAIIIYVDPDISYTPFMMEIICPFYYHTNWTSINGEVNADFSTVITYNTSHYNTPTTATSSWLSNKHVITLTNGTHFLTEQNFTVYIQSDGARVANFTVYYIHPDWKTEAAPLQGTDDDIIFILLFIGLIIMSMIIGVIIQSTTAGATTFRIGSIALSIVHVGFLNLAFINLLFYAARIFYKQIKE